MQKHKTKLTPLVGVVMLATGIVSLLISGCSQEDFPKGKYPVIDSGTWISHWGPFIWLDNNRLVFVSSESMRPDTRHLVRAIWKVGGQPVIDWKNMDALWCFDGHVLGFKQKTGATSWFKGPLGNEQPWDRRICRASNTGFVLPIIQGGTCDCFGDRDGPWKVRYAILLKEGHGWLDMGSELSVSQSLDNLPVTFHPAGGAPVPMPFHSREVGIISFYPWKNAYFIEGEYFNRQTNEGGASPWPKNLPRYAWWLELDGKITETVIPPAMKNKQGTWGELVPTKLGIATVSRSGWKSAHDPGDQGVYLINGEHVEKILDGTVEQMGASPDGCHLAVASAPNNATNHQGEYDKQFRTMKVIELCKPQERTKGLSIALLLEQSRRVAHALTRRCPTAHCAARHQS